MGGAAGHMKHPFENVNLTGQDLVDMFDSIVKGDTPTYEKVDGINLHLTMRGGKAVIARNKTTAVEPIVPEKLIGMISNDEAANVMISAARELEQLLRDAHIYDLSGEFINFEIMNDFTNRMFKYKPTIVMHSIVTFDEKGNVKTKECPNYIRGMIGDGIEFNVRGPNQITYIIDNHRYERYKESLLRTVPKDVTLNQIYKERLILHMKEHFNMDVTKAADDILDRWVMRNTSNMVKIKSNLDPKYSSEFTQIDKKQRYQIMRAIRLHVDLNIFKMGDLLLDDSEGTMSLTSKDDHRLLAVDVFMECSNKGLLDSSYMDVFAQLPGPPAPFEGVVFDWKDQTYKLTGSFALLNIAYEKTTMGRLPNA